MRVLLVENDEDLRCVLKQTLAFNCSLDIDDVNSGSAAIEAIQNKSKYDLIISDYNMPNGTGGDLLKFLAEIKSHTPFILCSSHRPADIPESNLYPIFGWVVKPQICDQLHELINQLAQS